MVSLSDVMAKVKAFLEGLLGICILRERYLPRGVKLDRDIKRYLPSYRADVVFDVGANTGQSARLFLIWFAGAQLFCFEPVESTFLQLEEDMKKQKRVHCCQLALGASAGKGHMVHRGSSDMFFLAKTLDELRQCRPEELERVTIQTLDNYCQDAGITRINFLKIDAEGQDLEILKGAEQLLGAQRIDIVQVEAGMHPANARHVRFEALKEFLERRQYYLFAIYEQMHEWTEHAPHLRRTNSVFISKQVIDSNRSVGSGNA